MMNFTRRTVLSIAGLTIAKAALADTVQLSGKVVLSVRGKIANSKSGQSIEFDMAMLEALPRTSFQTSSPWTEPGTAFEGVALKDFIQAVEATGRTLTARAINDYSASWPTSEAISGGAIIAYKTNGEYMSVREKGPLWIIYPFDDQPELRTETNYSRCVWQLSAIEFAD